MVLGPCPHEPGRFGNRICFTRIWCERDFKPLWRAVLKRCGFGERIYWFRVNDRLIHAKKMFKKNIRTRVRRGLSHFSPQF